LTATENPLSVLLFPKTDTPTSSGVVLQGIPAPTPFPTPPVIGTQTETAGSSTIRFPLYGL
jgi:hypothetical protein